MSSKNVFYKIFFSIIVIGLSSQTFAVDKGDWIVRFGAASVNPNDSSGELVAGVGVAVDDSQAAFANLSYMIGDNLALELLASTPFTHTISATGALSGEVAEVKQLPPTFSIQYHFTPKSNLRPYVGAGINYTIFFDEQATAVISSIDLDNSLGLAAQAGIDIDFTKNWFFNADLRYINIETTATTDIGSVDVTIDPWVLSLGIGTTF